MEYPNRHPLEVLVLFVAHKLKEQYAGQPAEEEFQEKINAVEEAFDYERERREQRRGQTPEPPQQPKAEGEHSGHAHAAAPTPQKK